jgi:hypothetical protein
MKDFYSKSVQLLAFVTVSSLKVRIASSLRSPSLRWHDRYRRNVARNLGVVPSSDDPHSAPDAVANLMLLASRHCTSQALYIAVQLRIPDIIGISHCKSLSAISARITREQQAVAPNNNIDSDALLRVLRLLALEGILHEVRMSGEWAFSLTATGALLRQPTATAQQMSEHTQQEASWASLIQHWMEPPLWNAWTGMPSYLVTQHQICDHPKTTPFAIANGIAVDEFYGRRENCDSLRYANAFVGLVADLELQACVEGFDWQTLSAKSVVDLGGHDGAVMEAVQGAYPDVTCFSLDRPSVVELLSTPSTSVTLLGGNLFNSSTFPPTDAIFMKHVVFCDWDDVSSMQILQACHASLPASGKLIIAEAVLPNCGLSSRSTMSKLQIYMSTMLLLGGRESAKTESEWSEFATQAGFVLQSVTDTCTPTCSILVFSKA